MRGATECRVSRRRPIPLVVRGSCWAPRLTRSMTSPRRTLEILRLLAQGRSLAQIAGALGISYKTAANNCSQIKAKLRAGSIADLIRIAIQHGLNDRDARRP